MPLDEKTNMSKGFAFIAYKSSQVLIASTRYPHSKLQ